MSFSPTSTQPHHLPTPRVLITNLINSLTSAPLPPSANTASIPSGGDAQNPLRTLPQSHRPLLVTLHVLFPSLVLPALDLLDRDLVTRVVPETTTLSAGLREDPTDPAPARQHQHGKDTASDTHEPGSSSPPRLQLSVKDLQHVDESQRDSAAFYLVRSVASTMTRRHHAVATSASASTTYLVQLDAWNCSCANFAYEAFPAVGSGSVGHKAGSDLVIMDADEAGDDSDPGCEVGDWQFGGLSLDGVDDGGVPCCKHLLACLLSQQWGDTLGKYVTDRRVSREEIAGLVADV
ncbi:hypothetical protein CORC01_08554 [Colletotrichum orchidophilum]|uniref:SWIM-type domain-containing protein n=1 Tax=Colletotrichum orchidophilum TaxID=1209926 RepID=A0A1G4B456_9PEZI|nr:uncharacterized protein CORC01_08554 [Colletotrichum orchidophilum]OHE96177.1 hypothetical protein CORC01_08554 [Colletotrichum orchidophilum]